MFRASSAHLQEDTVVHMQHMVLSPVYRVTVPYAACVQLQLYPPEDEHLRLETQVTVPYATCVQLYPPEDEHLRLETCRGV